MALVTADRVKETTTVTGTGAATLLGAAVGFQTFSAAIGNANTCYYVIAGQNTSEWEVGIGTYASAGNTLTRTTILSSSNAGSAVSFSAGTKDVFVTYTASRNVYLDASGNATALGTPASVNLTNATAVPMGQASGTLAVANGGTGAATLTANNVLLGNGTSALQVVAPGTSGNVLTSNGTTWASSSPAAPSILYNQSVSANTQYTVALSGTNRPVQIFMGIGAVQGGAAGIVITFRWGIGSLTSSYTPVNSGVNYVVYPCPSITTYVTPTTSSTLYLQVDTTNLGVTAVWFSVLQL